MDAALVRAFLAAADDRPPDGSGIARVRAGLEILGRPDVRLLVAALRGPGAPVVARYARRILEAAGAPTGRPDDPLDDTLFAWAGTEAASAAYSLGASRPDLGELTRAEVTLLLGVTAVAASSRRVVLLVDGSPIDTPTLFDAVTADVLALGGPVGLLAAVLGEVPRGRPVVIVPAPPGSSARIAKDPEGPENPEDPEDAMESNDAIGRMDRYEEIDPIAADRGLALVRAGREFAVIRREGVIDVTVAGETYVGLAAAAGDDPWQVAAGVATALAIATRGIRMRPEWVARGVAAAAAE